MILMHIAETAQLLLDGLVVKLFDFARLDPRFHVDVSHWPPSRFGIGSEVLDADPTVEVARNSRAGEVERRRADIRNVERRRAPASRDSGAEHGPDPAAR